MRLQSWFGFIKFKFCQKDIVVELCQFGFLKGKFNYDFKVMKNFAIF